MAQDSPELELLRKQTQMMANWEGSKAIFGGLVLGIFVGVPLAGMTALTSWSDYTIWAPVVAPILFAVLAYRGAMIQYAPARRKPVPKPSPPPAARRVPKPSPPPVLYSGSVSALWGRAILVVTVAALGVIGLAFWVTH